MLSNDPQLRSFQALREAYLPELGLWLSEYPFVERPLYTSVSDAIAEERAELFSLTKKAGPSLNARRHMNNE